MTWTLVIGPSVEVIGGRSAAGAARPRIGRFGEVKIGWIGLAGVVAVSGYPYNVRAERLDPLGRSGRRERRRSGSPFARRRSDKADVGRDSGELSRARCRTSEA